MPLPDFLGTGDLPTGIHTVSLKETIARFGSGSGRRKLLASRLNRVYQIALRTNRLARFIVFGSFVTNKSNPNDVDVFMIMEDNFDISLVKGEARFLFDHSSAQSYFGCSVFWMRRLAAFGGEQAAIEDWQIKRDGNRRGIIEITGDET